MKPSLPLLCRCALLVGLMNHLRRATGNIIENYNLTVIENYNFTEYLNYNGTKGPQNTAVFYSFIFNDKDLFPDFLNGSNIEEITTDAKVYLSSQWLTKFVPSVYTAVVVVSLPLNIIAIIMFILKVKIKTPAIVYMLNLAVADVLFVATLPFIVAYRFSGNDWKVGEVMCRIVTAAFYCNMYCSVLLLTSISVDRFLALVFTIKALGWRTKRRAWLICFFIWIISIASTVPILLTKQTKHLSTLNITSCHDFLDLTKQQTFYMYYFSVFSLILFFLPLVITTTCNISIVRTLSIKDIAGSSKKTRAVFLTILVFIVFVICFGPTNVIFLTHYLHFSDGFDESLYFAYVLSVCISSVSSCLDPLIYFYVSSRFRNNAYSLLCCKKDEALGSTLRKRKEPSTESTFTK